MKYKQMPRCYKVIQYDEHKQIVAEFLCEGDALVYAEGCARTFKGTKFMVEPFRFVGEAKIFSF